MLAAIRRFRADESGPTIVEYGLLVALIAVIVALAAQILGQNLSTIFSTVGAWIGSVPVPTSP